MMTDPIADMLTCMRNAVVIQKESVQMPFSRLKEGIADVLKEEGYIQDCRVGGEGPHKFIKIYLKYGPLGEKVIRQIDRVSRPGRRVYQPVEDLTPVYNGLGVAVVSTSKGIYSDRQCRKLNLGGEVLCTVF